MRIVDSGRKTGFIGFLLNMAAIEKTVSNYVISGPLDYLLTFKLSQVQGFLLKIFIKTIFHFQKSKLY